MMLLICLIIAAVAVVKVNALDQLPERARGGRAYKAQAQLMAASTTSSTPYAWNAQVDNFDQSNNSTYQQRYYVNDQVKSNHTIFINQSF